MSAPGPANTPGQFLTPPVPPQNLEQARWFTEEIQPHERSLRSYLQRTLPSLYDVDDIVQDCFTRILHAREKGEVRSPRPLLFTIARNAVRDFFHQKSRVEMVPINETAALPALDHGPDLLESICRRQELTLLAQAIDSLPTRCREVVLLRKIKGLSQKQIAETLGISEHTVEALAARGARRCADYLRRHGVIAAQTRHAS